MQERSYYVDKYASPTTQVNVVGSHNLWHGCLGHPSRQGLSLLPKNFNISSGGNKEPLIFVFVLIKHGLNLLLVIVMKPHYFD